MFLMFIRHLFANLVHLCFANNPAKLSYGLNNQIESIYDISRRAGSCGERDKRLRHGGKTPEKLVAKNSHFLVQTGAIKHLQDNRGQSGRGGF